MPSGARGRGLSPGWMVRSPSSPVPLFENAEDGRGGVEAVYGIVAAEDERGRMAAIDVCRKSRPEGTW